MTRQHGQVAHEHRSDTLTLISIYHDEGYSGLAGPDNDIAFTADNRWVSIHMRFPRRAATWLSKSMLRKKAISCFERPFFASEERRRSEDVVSPIAASISFLSSG